jgi:mannose-6-phosphate isomerase-like protein (cupin superfamily)
MKLEEFKKKAELTKDNEVYRIYDYKMERITLSITELKPHQETRGHDHSGVEEVYYFLKGKGKMQIEKKIIDVEEGDIVPIPDGKFHKVFNPSDKELKFFCIFEKYERE